MADQILVTCGGWGLTPSGVWVALDEPGALAQPPTVAEAEASAKSRTRKV